MSCISENFAAGKTSWRHLMTDSATVYYKKKIQHRDAQMTQVVHLLKGSLKSFCTLFGKKKFQNSEYANSFKFTAQFQIWIVSGIMFSTYISQ